MACTPGGIQVQPLCAPCTGTHTDPCTGGYTSLSCNANTVPNSLLLTIPPEALSSHPVGDPGTTGCLSCATAFAGSFVLTFNADLAHYAGGDCTWAYRKLSTETRCGYNSPAPANAIDWVFWFSGAGLGHVMLRNSGNFEGQQWEIHWEGTVTAGPGNCLSIDADHAWDRNEPFPFFEPFIPNRNCYGVPGVSVHVVTLN